MMVLAAAPPSLSRLSPSFQLVGGIPTPIIIMVVNNMVNING